MSADDHVREWELARGTCTGKTVPRREEDAAIIGIDFGSRWTVVSAMVDGRPVIIPWPGGALVGASLVHFPNPREMRVGPEAEYALGGDPGLVVAPRNLLGRFTAPFIGLTSTRVDDHGFLEVAAWGQWLPVHVLAACILASARRAAYTALNRPVGGAVLTIPAETTEAERQQLMTAARLAHLPILDVIDQPNAMAAAFSAAGQSGKIGIYDLGATHCRFSVVDLDSDDLSVSVTAVDHRLGASAYDGALAEAVAICRPSLANRPMEMRKVLNSCTAARNWLVDEQEARIFVPGFLNEEDLELTVDREMFDEIAAPLVERSARVCWDAITAAGVKASELAAIHLVGGGARMQVVKRVLEESLMIPVEPSPVQEPAAVGAVMVVPLVKLSGQLADEKLDLLG